MKSVIYINGQEAKKPIQYSGLIFIDAGARKGELLKGSFFNSDLSIRADRKITAINTFANCHMILIEPDPNHFEDLCEVAKKASIYASSVTVNVAALWDSNNGVVFYRSEGKSSDYGSTALIDKKNPYESDYERLITEDPLKVDTIDIIDLIKNINGSIYFKTDTEGGEYVILPRLLDSTESLKIKGLFVEWHQVFFPERHKDFSDNYLNKLKNLISLGMEYHSWPAEW